MCVTEVYEITLDEDDVDNVNLGTLLLAQTKIKGTYKKRFTEEGTCSAITHSSEKTTNTPGTPAQYNSLNYITTHKDSKHSENSEYIPRITRTPAPWLVCEP